MTETTIIQPNRSLLSHRPEWEFVSRPFLQPNRLQPNFFSILRKSDGSVTRYDYASVLEYQSHYDHVVAVVSKRHRAQGNVVFACECNHCKGEK